MLNIIFLWDNFGPTHADRCEAVAKDLGSLARVTGLELHGRSTIYDWVPEDGEGFRKITLFPDQTRRPGALALLRALIAFRWREGRGIWFLCHYERPYILLFALILRIFGDKVLTMADSKFDDYPRYIWRELGKRLFMLPYQGAIGCGIRSRDYLRFLGIRRDRIVPGYDTLSLDRIREMAGAIPAPGGLEHGARHFTIIARHVPKKNLPMALLAYALYASRAEAPRPLHLCGSGPLEPELRSLVQELGVAEMVVFHGFIQTDAIARCMASTLALILPSVEEQFGLVVIEAQAMGLPVIVSDVCGARDDLVRNAVNGFVVEPDNPAGLAWFMTRLASDEALWRELCTGAARSAPQGDVTAFTQAVRALADF